jgi:DNA segregation ATPase FtsK/SpoIIIE, S-DNA-T family
MDDGEDDELVEQAMEIIRETRRASTSSLQRRMRIGYTRAARIIDILEERGIVGPPCGAGPREILIDLDVEMDNGDYAPEDEANDIENPDEENT